jgi:tetratricopeptide (TPR) repeat protein
MRRVPWGKVLIGGVLLSVGLGFLYFDRRVQAAQHQLEGLKSYRAHDWQTAEADFSQVIRLAPPFCSDAAEGYAWRGHVRNQQKEHALAIDDFNEAIRRNPASAGAFFGRGAAYSALGQTDEALADFDEAIRLNPKNWRSFYNRGLCHLKKSEFAEALADLNEAIGREPKDVTAHRARSQVYAKQGDMARAEEDRKKADELSASADEPMIE